MMHWIRGALPHHEETNVIFFRGLPLDALVRGLLVQRRMPLAYGTTPGWGMLMHDMNSWDSGDHDLAHYGRLCKGGGELAVFVTEPCWVKAHGPLFEYYRDGNLITGFNFENPSNPVGEEPDLLQPVLMAANLIGPMSDLDRDDNEERTVQAIAGFFSLPELEMP
ncbi:hypothetical protein [Streptomyces sp. NPDC057939]|uniref:hypothetical protein n=1 Tax=Streptomyces sp. NPDC057939 TaxID=3346284 RepID=UPI0036E50793